MKSPELRSGTVEDISDLRKDEARVTLRVQIRGHPFRSDSTRALIRTSGVLGDKYVELVRLARPNCPN